MHKGSSKSCAKDTLFKIALSSALRNPLEAFLSMPEQGRQRKERGQNKKRGSVRGNGKRQFLGGGRQPENVKEKSSPASADSPFCRQEASVHTGKGPWQNLRWLRQTKSQINCTAASLAHFLPIVVFSPYISETTSQEANGGGGLWAGLCLSHSFHPPTNMH